MSESNLISISLALSIIGIIILFFISDRIKVKEYQIKDIMLDKTLSKDLLEKDIIVKGIITNLKETANSLLITISENKNYLKIIVYKKNNLVKLKEGQRIEVKGKLKTFEKEFEIEASEIKLI